MRTPRTLGVAVVGLGVGESHARTYARLPGCELRWLLDLQPGRAQALARDLGRGRVAADLAEVLADPAVDAVSIASYDHMHANEVRAALEAGKHVFVEKPLCRTDAEFAAIIESWRAKGRPQLRSNLVLRAAPLYRWLKDEISCGRLGRVYAFDGDYLYGRLEKVTHGWRAGVPDYSVMAGGGIHLVDLMLWLAGERPEWVTAAAGDVATRGSQFRYADFEAATFGFASGLIGRVSANFGCVHRHQHVVRVFGTEATFVHDDMGARLHRSRDEEGRAEPLAHAPLAPDKGALIPEFVDAILAGRDSTAAAEREFDLVRVVAAAGRAAASGARERIA